MKFYFKSYIDNHTENFYNFMLFMVLFISTVCCIRILLLLGTNFLDSLLNLCQ